MGSYQVVVVILDDLLFVYIEVDAEPVHKRLDFPFIFVFAKEVAQPLPYAIVNNVVFVHKDILIQLDEIDHTPDIRFVKTLDRVDVLVADFDGLFRANVADEFADFQFRQLVETDTNKLMLQRQLDFADVIAYQKELDIVAAYL
jgi:hypothetical protein